MKGRKITSKMSNEELVRAIDKSKGSGMPGNARFAKELKKRGTSTAEVRKTMKENLDEGKEELSGFLDDAARGLRTAERAMESANKVKMPLSNVTQPLKKALVLVTKAKKAVMDLPI